jgi:hypothetical protein
MRIADKYHFFYFLLAIVIISCRTADPKDLVVNNSIINDQVKVNPEIKKDTSIRPLMIKHYPDTNYLLSEKNVYCNFLDDTIIILFGKPDGWAVYRTEIKIVGPEFRIVESHSGCITNDKYSTILQELVCNKGKYRIGDTLVANIRYMGVYYSEGDYLQNDTIFIEGAFRSIIQDTFYTFQKLNREDKYQTIKRWAHDCPDSITSLSWNFDTICVLPIELMNFTRLYSLDLRGTDLSNADLQVLGKISTLINLDLGSTNLPEIPSGVLSQSHLVRLKLDNNSIEQIPTGLYSLTRLSILNLAGNQISEISDSIYKLRRLTELRFNGNPTLHLPDAIAHLKLLSSFFPPENLEFLSLNLVDVLEPGVDYSSIGNFREFKDDVPKIGEYHVNKHQDVVKFTFP